MPPSAPPRLLRWTRFASNAQGTGPEKRTAQILELVRAAGYDLSDMVMPPAVPRIPGMLAGFAALLRHGTRASVDHAGAGLLGYRSIAYRQALAAHSGPKVLLWETTYDDVLPALAHDLGYRVIALPHNLESLVSDSVFRHRAYEPCLDLAAEIRRLRLADHVFTISREERWLLEARGLSPDYLPFFPTGELAAACATVRAVRQRSAETDGFVNGPLLILGSAFNPATARGMQHQLEWLRSDPATIRDVIVAGPDTDRLFAGLAGSRIRVMGEVPREQLVGLITGCSALLVHTIGGAGAVTRIPEALYAGIPVATNSNGARDQHGTAGVHVYGSEKEFSALVRARLPIPPCPPDPVASIHRFGETLRRLVPPS
jgi:hypothetical protein